jgi:hypothetical protein
MLVVKVIPGESVCLFDKNGKCIARVKFCTHQGHGIRMGFACPDDVSVVRENLLDREQAFAAMLVK